MQEIYQSIIQNLDYIIPGSVVAFCWYMSKRGQRKAEAANQRMRMFEEDLKMDPHQDIEALTRKYNLITINATPENPGPMGALKTEVNSKGKLEEFISDGNQWLKVKFGD